MDTYNNFSSAQRNKAQRWLTAQWAAGTLARPSRCCACGQTEGILDAHAEDYSEPFAAGKTDEFPLCFRCHMMVHCRAKAPDAWERYKAAIVAGTRFAPFLVRNWYGFRAQHLTGWRPAIVTACATCGLDPVPACGCGTLCCPATTPGPARPDFLGQHIG